MEISIVKSPGRCERRNDVFKVDIAGVRVDVQLSFSDHPCRALYRWNHGKEPTP